MALNKIKSKAGVTTQSEWTVRIILLFGAFDLKTETWKRKFSDYL